QEGLVERQVHRRGSAGETADGCACALEKCVLVVAVGRRQRGAETHRTNQRNREQRALRHAAVKVLDVYRDQFALRKLLRQLIEPALERTGKRLRTTRAFGKYDQ